MSSDLDQEIMGSEEVSEGSESDSDGIASEGEESGIENDESISEDDDDDDEEDVSFEEDEEEASEAESESNDNDNDTENNSDSDDNDSSFEANANSGKAKNKNSKQMKKQQQQQQIPFNQPKVAKKIANIKQNYEERKGKSLFVRFTHHVTENLKELEKEINGLCSGAIKVRRPRQKSTRFCLVDFNSKEDRDKALKELKKAQANGKIGIVDIPKTENDDVVEEIIEKRKKKTEEKRAKQKIRKVVQEKVVKEKPKKEFTSTILVKNLPVDATASQLREIFANAVDVQIPSTKKDDQDTLIATITLPTPKDATKARRKKYQIAGNNLKIFYAKSPPKKQVKSGQQNGNDVKLQSKHKLEEDNEDIEESPSPKKKKMNLEKQNSPNKVILKKKPFNKKFKPQKESIEEEGGQVKSPAEGKKKMFKQKKMNQQQHPGGLLKKKTPQQGFKNKQQSDVPSKKPNKMKKLNVPFKKAQLSGKAKEKNVKT